MNELLLLLAVQYEITNAVYFVSILFLVTLVLMIIILDELFTWELIDVMVPLNIYEMKSRCLIVRLPVICMRSMMLDSIMSNNGVTLR